MYNVRGGYQHIEHWHEMTITKAIELQQVIDGIPDNLRKLYDLTAQGDAAREDYNKLHDNITDEEFAKIFPEFYGRVIMTLSDIPEEKMRLASPGDRAAFYLQYSAPFVFGLLYWPDFTPSSIKYFEWEGVQYWLPEARIVLDHNRVLDSLTAIEFCEAADLQVFVSEVVGGLYGRAANIISILCRPKVWVSRDELATPSRVLIDPEKRAELLKHLDDHRMTAIEIIEPYDEKVCLQRAERFKGLTMDIVWEVFFCSRKLKEISDQFTPRSLVGLRSVLEVSRSTQPSLTDTGGT